MTRKLKATMGVPIADSAPAKQTPETLLVRVRHSAPGLASEAPEPCGATGA
jgi:hypothetical protein